MGLSVLAVGSKTVKLLGGKILDSDMVLHRDRDGELVIRRLPVHGEIISPLGINRVSAYFIHKQSHCPPSATVQNC